MDLPISIDVHPSSPPSRLQSPEPSGTPDLRRLSSHRCREAASFGYGHGMLSIASDEVSPNFSQRQVDYIETSLLPSENQILQSMSSFSEAEERGIDMMLVCQRGSPLDGIASRSSLMGDEWHAQPTTSPLVEHLEGHPQLLKDELRPCSQEDLPVGGMHAKLFDLIQKVSSSHWNPPLKTSSSVSLPLKSRGTFTELQKKVEVLKSQLIEERSQRQTVARQLNTLRRENEKDLQHKQKIWENKFREVQKEKYNLSVRLQIKSEKKFLEKKIVDFEKMKTQKKHREDALDASCQCMMLPDDGSELVLSDTCELNEREGNIECYEVQNLENHGDKENFVHSNYNLQIQLGEEEEKNRSLQKRIERMKRDYDLKIKDLKQQIEKKAMASQDIGKASTRRVKELEAQINDIRSFYTKKLKVLSEKADESSMKKSEGKIITDTPKVVKAPKTSMMQALKLSEKRVALLEESLKEKTAIIKHLESNFLSTIHKQGSEESCAGDLGSDTRQEISPQEEPLSRSLENMSLDKVHSSIRHDTSDASQTKIGKIADTSLSEGHNQVSRTGFNDIARSATYMYPPQELQKKFSSDTDAASFKQQVEVQNCTSKGNQYNKIPEQS